MKPSTLLFLLFLLFPNCQKPEPTLPPTPCELENWGHLHIENFQSDPIEIYFDGMLQTKVLGGQSADLLQFPAGTYRVDFKNERTGGQSFIDDFEVLRCRTNLLAVVF